MTTFVSDDIRKMARETLKNVDRNCSYHGEAHLYAAILNYKPEPTVRSVPKHYFDSGVVAFTKPDEGEIAMPPIEFIPYLDGVHSWAFVLEHEKMHNYIHRAGGIQDERGINAYVRAKLGYSKDPFPSY